MVSSQLVMTLSTCLHNSEIFQLEPHGEYCVYFTTHSTGIYSPDIKRAMPIKCNKVHNCIINLSIHKLAL